jgi:hypothetical protein
MTFTPPQNEEHKDVEMSSPAHQDPVERTHALAPHSGGADARAAIAGPAGDPYDDEGLVFDQRTSLTGEWQANVFDAGRGDVDATASWPGAAEERGERRRLAVASKVARAGKSLGDMPLRIREFARSVRRPRLLGRLRFGAGDDVDKPDRSQLDDGRGDARSGLRDEVRELSRSQRRRGRGTVTSGGRALAIAGALTALVGVAMIAMIVFSGGGHAPAHNAASGAVKRARPTQPRRAPAAPRRPASPAQPAPPAPTPLGSEFQFER